MTRFYELEAGRKAIVVLGGIIFLGGFLSDIVYPQLPPFVALGITLSGLAIQIVAEYGFKDR